MKLRNFISLLLSLSLILGVTRPLHAESIDSKSAVAFYDRTNLVFRYWSAAIAGDVAPTALPSVAMYLKDQTANNYDRVVGIHGDLSTYTKSSSDSLLMNASFIFGLDVSSSTIWRSVGIQNTPAATITASNFLPLNTSAVLYALNGSNLQMLTTAPTPQAAGTLPVASAFGQAIAVLANVARTTSSDSGTITGYGSYRSCLFETWVTAASGTNPTLDVYLDTITNGSTGWTNVGHYTQFTTTGRRTISVTAFNPSLATDFDATSDAAAGVVRQIDFGSSIRIRWVIGGTTPSFNFAVNATCKS